MTYRRFLFLVLCLAAVCVFSGCRSKSGEELLVQGIDKLKQGQNAKAASMLEQAVIQLPSNAAAQCNLGIAYWKLNRTEDAVAAFRTAADLNSQDTVALEYIASILKQAGDLEGARKALKKASLRLPGSPRILTAVAVLDLEADNTYAAYDVLMKSLEVDPDYPPALYNLARLYREKMNNRKMASRFYEKYIRIADQSVSEQERAGFKARVELARRYLEVSGREPAPGAQEESEPQQEPEPQPEQSAGVIADARKAMKSGEVDKALALLKKAVRKDPGDADALWELALLYDKKLKFKTSAAKLYKEFARRFPDDPRSPREAGPGGAESTGTDAGGGTSTGTDGATEQAPQPGNGQARTGKNGRDLDPRRIAIELRSRGLQCHHKKDFEGAIRYYRQALEYNSRDFTTLFNLGLAYMDNKQFAEAKDMLIEALKIQPGLPEANCMLGCCFAELGDTARAVEYLNRSLRKNPDHLAANYYLGQLYAQLKKYDMARTHLELCVRLDPASTEGKNAKVLLESMKTEQKPPRPR